MTSTLHFRRARGLSAITGLLALLAGCSAASTVNEPQTSSGDGENALTAARQGEGRLAVSALRPEGSLAAPLGCSNPQPIVDPGYPGFRSYADVNGDAIEDYCRFVGNPPQEFLSCLLGCPGGNYGDPAGFSSIPGIDQGYAGTQAMRDVNHDGQADFCRLVGNPGGEFISCDLATATGFDPNPSTLNLPPPAGCSNPQPIADLGYPVFRTYADANGDTLEDYCRFIGDPPREFLSCLLACPGGNYGDPVGFNSIQGIDQGYAGTQVMHDVNQDGQADFCRLVGNPGGEFISCDLATAAGFDANPSTFNLPANTPMFAAALSEVTASPVAGRTMTLNVAVTNNLPYAAPGTAYVVLTPSGGGTATTTYAQGAALLPPGSTTTEAVTLTAPAAGTYTTASGFLQTDGHVSSVAVQTAGPNVQVLPAGLGNACGVTLTSVKEYATIGNALTISWTLQRDAQPAGYGDPILVAGKSLVSWFDDQGNSTNGIGGPIVTATSPTAYTLAVGGSCGGQVIGSVNATRQSAIPMPIVFSASTTNVQPGGTTFLSWGIGSSATNLCYPSVNTFVVKRVSDGKILQQGTPYLSVTKAAESLASTTQFTLTSKCVNQPSLVTTRSITVNVVSNPPPPPTSCVPAGATAGRSMTIFNNSQSDSTVWVNDVTLGTWNEEETVSPGSNYTFTPAAGQACHTVNVIALEDSWITNYNETFGTSFSPDDEFTAQNGQFQAVGETFIVQASAGALTQSVTQ